MLNQYGHTIKEWMSDAGGEYKSDAFLGILKAKGIKILQTFLLPPSKMDALNDLTAPSWIKKVQCELKLAFLNPCYATAVMVVDCLR